MDQTTDKPDLSTYREQYSYYARRLLSDLGLGDIPQPERGQLLAAIEKYVQQVILNALLENLDEASLDKAEAILGEEASNEEAIVALLASVPDVEVKIADALAKTYARMLEETRQLAKAIATQSSKPPQS